MPANPKVLLHNTMVFITTSVEEGIMFPPNALIRELMLSSMMKAWQQYPIEICDFVVSTTHVHMLVRVTNPAFIPGFMERFKTESAHALNRLLGRQKRTVWCEGYDSPRLVTPYDVFKKKIYLYTNPCKDSIHPQIRSYPGLSSWKLLKGQKRHLRACLISRDDYWELPPRELSVDDYRAFARRLTRNKKRHLLPIHPDAWLQCFGLEQERAEYNRKILKQIQEAEDEFEQERRREGRSCIPFTKLISTPIGKPYQPERSGKKMLCHCHDKEIRKAVIRECQELIARGREVLMRWRAGDYSLPFPLGLFPPSMPRTGELLPAKTAA